MKERTNIYDTYLRRFAVCKRCHCKMVDCEPGTMHGEFWHRTNDKRKKYCKNEGKRFSLTDHKEIELYVRKRVRRAAKKLGVTVANDG